MRDLSSHLSQAIASKLSSDIAQLFADKPKNSSEILALRRLQALAQHSPLILTWLAEPWWATDIEETLVHCGRIHLYARVLDDALDENLPIHRLLLLRIQSLLWSTTGELAKCYSQYWQQSEVLITETINAVENDGTNIIPASWGAKNHHLLLIPLLLSNDSHLWRQAKPALSDFIWLMQVGDEWRQNSLNTQQIKHNVLAEVERIMEADIPSLLFKAGWTRASERSLWEAQQLLRVLPK